MNDATETLYAERTKRVEEAIALRVPDRVPFFPQTNFLALQYGRVTGKEAFYDYEKWFSACKTMNTTLAPDLCWPPLAAIPGRGLDILDCSQVSWPGHGAPEDSSVQYTNKEYMRADEIDRFIEDPTDFLMRIYLPRVFRSLAPLAALPSLKSLFYHGYKAVLTLSAFSDDQVAAAIKCLVDAVVESNRYASHMTKYEKELKTLGLVQAFSGLSVLCPFDVLGDYYRGIHGIMTDMYRRPEKLIAAMEKIQPMLLEKVKDVSKTSQNRRIFIPLHLGADGFMSAEQFERFYWPYLKSMLIELIAQDFTPCPFFEGDYTSRLHYLAELPKGKIMGLFDQTDLFKAKEIIGDTMCIVGNMPVSILQHGTPEKVRAFAKQLIDTVGADGGFIMSSRSVLDTANRKLVEIWADYTKEYGTYA